MSNIERYLKSCDTTKPKPEEKILAPEEIDRIIDIILCKHINGINHFLKEPGDRFLLFALIRRESKIDASIARKKIFIPSLPRLTICT